MRCARCHQDFHPSRSDAVYCSGRCRVAALRFRESIPAQLRDRDRWVRYSAKKVPLQLDGRAARSNDPQTWSTFDDALASDAGVGLGFVLDGDGIVCIDLDNAIDSRGRMKPWAREIVDFLPPTFAEISPSGRGLHIWGLGKVDAGRRWAYADGGVEIYGTLRYMTVTGRRVRKAPMHLARLSDHIKTLEARCGLGVLQSPSSSTSATEPCGPLGMGIVLAL